MRYSISWGLSILATDSADLILDFVKQQRALARHLTGWTGRIQTADGSHETSDMREFIERLEHEVSGDGPPSPTWLDRGTNLRKPCS